MFGGGSQQSGVSDLLLGAGGFSGSLGNGFGNDTGGAPASSAPGGSTGGTTAFDLSDFPSLGGGGSSGGGGSGGGSSASANNPSNGLAAALREQQQLLAHQQMLQGQGPVAGTGKQQNNLYRLAMSGGSNGGGNFNMATEDFPALPGAPPQSSGNSGSNGSAPSSSPSLLIGGTNNAVSNSQPGIGFGAAGGSRVPSSGSGGLYRNDLDGGSAAPAPGGSQLEGVGLLGGSGIGGLAGLGGLQQNAGNQPSQLNLSVSRGPGNAVSSSGPGSGSATGTALSGDYGLLGLLGVIRMTDADRNALALGSDLTLLGLNLGSSEQIYNTFASPFSESTSSTKEPHYQLPMCYYMQPPALKTGHLSKFQLETLFYIFYALPKDVLQAYAAQELYSREWRYHADLKLWFKQAGPADGITPTSGGSQYLYFDINSWERRLFNGNMNQNVTNGFLTEEDVRVKFPSS
mmetsp:Transcript_1642/g.2317  ORF Transcript_1642/g.2317 Transcript_1642/m.2317 type:complete len:459 (-) Transcript_1642:118-1494(-)|eukprot:CAMPEP_0117060326 /NCGR_PEP_ID=MMETSP0472-20121206/41931_1 /TAXON_ID=693140 ORGANISM="Tiarina fusus, Strain LIS" /NCGR_SAMPLE_ID=MMETSP0472 /ASSEMBLY_ACC=CAM_ASM_000603 /LENGTH=458 /DNA_ID=CAMNT_0004778433 /DNA_START=141 /DNA_END=1517 /DNA_ORIENTATION=-